ncbi:MAG: mechanosensitive ion channel family protein, partial [Dehalococcoidia bacterium]
MQFLDARFFGNTVQQWLIGLLVGVVTLVAVRLFEKVVIRRLAAVATRTETHWDDLVAYVLQQTKLSFLVVVGVYAAALVLVLPERVRAILTGVTVIALVIQGGFWASGAITFSLDRYRERQLKEDPASVTTMNAVGFVSRLLLWSAVLLLALDNLGVNITTLVAGLGVGGIAVALAVQSVLGDLFASLSIVLDKPFVIGDFLIIDEHRGAVEHIGLKTTRIRSLSGEQ